MNTIRFITVFAALCLVLAACNSSESARQFQPRKHREALTLETVVIPAIQAKPMYSGQLFHYHENFTITASGSINLSPSQQNVLPEGLKEVCGPNCINPQGHRGALTAIIREAADDTFACAFEVGAGYAGRPKCQGRLFLAVNDDEFMGSSGSFSAQFETFRLTRSSACRKACLIAQEAQSKTCTDSCDSGDEVVDSVCVRSCAQQAGADFQSCMNNNCTSQSDNPADCGQVCSQAAQTALHTCITACPPATPENACTHIECSYHCLQDFHSTVGGCIVGTCQGDSGPQQCVVGCYDSMFSCLNNYYPDACEYFTYCMDSLNDCSYNCANGYFPCIDHPDCL